jgi:proteasome lid subunit RPN8/RPN11
VTQRVDADPRAVAGAGRVVPPRAEPPVGHLAASPPGTTPVLVKAADPLPWPRAESLFYVVARGGLYRCRNHPLFQSCVKVEDGPSELAEQAPFLLPRFPVIPRPLFERAVGFFHRVAERHGSEAALLLAWDRSERRVRLVVPEQTATVVRTASGHRSPLGVRYLPPAALSPDWLLFGDVHSHVHHPAYASATDQEDEAHAPGVHIVVGHIEREPPDLHFEAVVDGQRFPLEAEHVIEGYTRRRLRVPGAWLERVRVETFTSVWSTGSRR